MTTGNGVFSPLPLDVSEWPNRTSPFMDPKALLLLSELINYLTKGFLIISASMLIINAASQD